MTPAAASERSTKLPRAEPSQIQVQVLRGIKSFLDMKPQWDALHAQAALPHHVFQSHNFLRHWMQQYAQDGCEIVIITGTIKGQVSMVWPLLLRRSFGIKILTFMGSPVAQFFDLLVADGPHRDELISGGWRALQEIGADVFVARNVRDDAWIRAGVGPKLVKAFGRKTAPFAILDNRVQGAEPGTAYSARMRSNYRRRLRRLGESGEISFDTLHPGDKAAELAAIAVSLKHVALLERLIWSPTLADPRFTGFFDAIARDRESAIRISTIACAGKPIGIDLSFDCRDHTFGHVLAADPNFLREGVGSVLIHQSFMSAAGRGMRTFELMAPADEYKKPHSDGEIGVCDVSVAFSSCGRLYQGFLSKGRPFAKYLVRALAALFIAHYLLRRVRRHAC